MSVETVYALHSNGPADRTASLPSAGASRAGELDLGPAEWEDTRLVIVPVDQVRPDPQQPRKHFDEESLAELGWSLRVVQIQPIVLRREAGGWVLVDGERRWRAARLEGLQTLVAREIKLTQRVELVSMVIQLAANTHRDQLTLEEQATGVLRLAEGGLPVSAIARVLGHHEDRIVSLLAVARSGDARELIAAGRLASVSAWDAYCALEPIVRKEVLDSTDPVTLERCERVRLEHERAERAKQQRLAMRRPIRRAQPQGSAALRPVVEPAAEGGVGANCATEGKGGSASSAPLHRAQAADTAAVDIPAWDGEAGGTQDSAEARAVGHVPAAAASTGAVPQWTHAEALAAFHGVAHEEREALIEGLDGVREQLDSCLATLGVHSEITDAALAAVRTALAPAEEFLDAALKRVVRPPELPPCCAQAFAARALPDPVPRDTHPGCNAEELQP